MPIDIIGTAMREGPDKIPGWPYIKAYTPPLVLGALMKLYFSGSSNTWDRDLHSKVYIMTGGTSGIGAALARELATRGAQLVLLTSQLDAEGNSTLWLTDYIQDLREATNNELIYAEHCDLSSLYSVRKFATKWLDSKPARRLDGVLCLAGESLPLGKARTTSVDGVEIQMAINYLAHYHLLTLLEPALKVQTPGRDVRVLLTTCLSQSMGLIDLTDLLWDDRRYPKRSPWTVYGTSKLLLNMFGKEYQRRLDKVGRPDKQPLTTRMIIVNPGIVRTPSTRRSISMGTVWGLLMYLILYPIFWLFFKSAEKGMQSFMYAVNCPDLIDIKGGQYVKECSVIKQESRGELENEELQKQVFDLTKVLIDSLEKRSAIERNKLKSKTEKKSAKEAKEARKAAAGKTSGAENNKSNKETDKNTTKSKKKGKKDELSMFESSFNQNEELFPNMSKLAKKGSESGDKGKEDVLRQLDARFEAARSRMGAPVDPNPIFKKQDKPVKEPVKEPVKIEEVEPVKAEKSKKGGKSRKI